MFPIQIRVWNPTTDTDFIYSTWIKSFRLSALGRGVPSPLYEMGQRSRINRILNHPLTEVWIACDPQAQELIYGYLVIGGENIIHYLYVKNAYRKQGIGSELLSSWFDRDAQFTHKGKDIWIEALMRNKREFRGFIYNPYLLEA